MQKLKDYALIFFGGIAAILTLLSFRSKKNSNLVKDYYDEKRKNYDLKIALNHRAIVDTPIDELLKPGEHIQEIKPESKD